DIAHLPDTGAQFPFSFQVSFAAFAIVMDFALTFVTPALAYTTRSVVRAVGHRSGDDPPDVASVSALRAVPAPRPESAGLPFSGRRWRHAIDNHGRRHSRWTPGKGRDCCPLPSHAGRLQRGRNTVHHCPTRPSKALVGAAVDRP